MPTVMLVGETIRTAELLVCLRASRKSESPANTGRTDEGGVQLCFLSACITNSSLYHHMPLLSDLRHFPTDPCLYLLYSADYSPPFRPFPFRIFVIANKGVNYGVSPPQ